MMIRLQVGILARVTARPIPKDETSVYDNGTERVAMHYLVSGHCTDGRDADEFVTKDNVISINGREVSRLRP